MESFIMSRYPAYPSPAELAAEWIKNLIRTVLDNIAFVLFGGVFGCGVGYMLLPVSHSLASRAADGMHLGFSPGAQVVVRYLTLLIATVAGARVGLGFSQITNGPCESDDPETDLEAILDAERQDWSDFRD
jgi:hypothetical protein